MSHYKHLTIQERESILKMLAEGSSIRQIASSLRRSPSTISREIRRNAVSVQQYSPFMANFRYNRRRTNCRRPCLLTHLPLRQFVQDRILLDQWSPEQIASRLKYEASPLRISTASIYRGIACGLLDAGKRSIRRHLRHKGKRRRKHGEETRGKIRISHPLEERPAEAEERKRNGHWEADTVLGKIGSACLVTLVDRRSRYTLCGKAAAKKAADVSSVLIQLLREMPDETLRSVTPDRGKEFAGHADVTEKLEQLPFYFPEPHQPWKRGTNENTNGLIREYIPKSTEIRHIPDEQIQVVSEKLNRRPRKCLDWKTPFEVFWDAVLHFT